MKTVFAIIFIVLTFQAYSQMTNKIKLPEPCKDGGMPLMEALAKRSSSRSFDATQTLNKQDLSNLLWCANGFNRKLEKRTAPSALNMQEIDVYVFLDSGIYLWNPRVNVLNMIKKGDYREKTGKQDYVQEAAVNLVYVSDYSKMDKLPDDNVKLIMTTANCGHISQNVYLYAASKNLGAVVRGAFDGKVISELLNLTGSQHVVLCQSVGPKSEETSPGS